jgi:hypothetical protein
MLQQELVLQYSLIPLQIIHHLSFISTSALWPTRYRESKQKVIGKEKPLVTQVKVFSKSGRDIAHSRGNEVFVAFYEFHLHQE